MVLAWRAPPQPLCQVADLTSRRAHSRRAASRGTGPRRAAGRARHHRCGAPARPGPVPQGKAATPQQVTAVPPVAPATGTGCPGAWLLGLSAPVGQHRVAWVERHHQGMLHRWWGQRTERQRTLVRAQALGVGLTSTYRGPQGLVSAAAGTMVAASRKPSEKLVRVMQPSCSAR